MRNNLKIMKYKINNQHLGNLRSFHCEKQKKDLNNYIESPSFREIRTQKERNFEKALLKGNFASGLQQLQSPKTAEKERPIMEVKKDYDAFQKTKKKKHTRRYLSSLHDLFYRDKKAKPKSKINKSRSFTNKIPSLSPAKFPLVVKKPKIQIKKIDLKGNSNLTSFDSEAYSKKTRSTNITQRNMNFLCKNKAATANDPKRTKSMKEMAKYDMLVDQTKTIKNIINYNKIQNPELLKDEDEEYLKFDDSFFDNYGKMFLRLTNKNIFFDEKSEKAQMLKKFMRRRSINFEKKRRFNDEIYSYSQKVVKKIKSQTDLLKM